ncbi:MAG TPA: hypothetical protein VKV74_06385 [Bryobacteraceae bacterium]|nr:hypothetical protein [Bryobacteraceae bacterium]
MKKWMPTGLGAEPKKLAILGALLVAVVAAYKFSNASAGSPADAAPVRFGGVAGRQPSDGSPVPNVASAPRRASRSGPGSSGIADFHPSLKLDEGADVSKIDPALRLDLLAKLQQVPMEGGSRNLFEFTQPPPPPAPKVIVKPGPVSAQPSPPPPRPVDATPPPPPPPPPIPLKFYGYAGVTRNGLRRAFFLDGDEIYTPAENETIKGRYKVIRIGVNSAVVEDLTNKNQQTLPLVEELGA